MESPTAAGTAGVGARAFETLSTCSCLKISYRPQVVWSPRLQPAPLAMRAWACAVVLSASAGLWLLYLITTGAQHLANECTQQTELGVH